jgi:DNA-3-methyladenine glycosylase II
MPRKLEFAGDSDAVVYLSACDATLARLIADVGPLAIELRDDRFIALARAIVGQQLSVAAAATIWGRVVALLGDVSPEAVLAAEFDALRGVGLSNAKARYLADLSERVRDGSLSLEGLDALSDADVIDAVTAVKGIGRWTAEMFLIFSLGRPDVFAIDDVGIQRAMLAAYGIDRANPEALTAAAAPWQPYRTTASLYLWEALDSGVLRP